VAIRDAIAEIARLTGDRVGGYGGCDPGRWLPPGFGAVHPQAADYFARHIPSDVIDRFGYALVGPRGVAWLSEEATPGWYVRPHGVLAVGVTPGGDAVALDCHSGAVYVLSHEVYSDEGISLPFDPRTNTFPKVPITPATITATAEERFDGLGEFLAHWERRAREALREMAAEPAAAPPPATE
jgi:hypothetical protein